MKKIIAGVIGALVVAGAGVGLWMFLDSSTSIATVGKTKITANQVNGSVKTVLAERKKISPAPTQVAVGAALKAEELNYYIVLTLLEHTGAAKGVTVTDAQVKTRVAAITKQEGTAAKLSSDEAARDIASTDFFGYVKEIIYVEGLTSLVEKQGTSASNSGTAVQALLAAQAAKEGVKIDSKYGTWDGTNVAVIPPSTTTTTK